MNLVPIFGPTFLVFFPYLKNYQINQHIFGDGRVSQGKKRFDKYANIITVGQMVENICTM